MEERSLDEFVETTEDGSDSDGDERTVTESDDDGQAPPEPGDNQTAPDSDGDNQVPLDSDDSQTAPDSDASERVPPESVEPAAVTSRVVPGGTACEGCGTQVSRLWTGEDGERCRDCREW